MWRELQRIISRTEPELGLGAITTIKEDGFLEVHFPKAGEIRRYSSRNAPLHRFTLKKGQKAKIKGGEIIEVMEIVEDDQSGLVQYHYVGGQVWEFDLEDRVFDQGGVDHFFAGHFTHHHTYELRKTAQMLLATGEAQGVQGLVGPRVTPLAHQLYIASEVARRPKPRVLLADEVGLGKTIEAGLIFSTMKSLGRADRVLIVTPPSLKHQWLAEMFRRFHQLFSVVDGERAEEDWSSQGLSPFAANQHVIVAMDYFLGNEQALSEAMELPWDLMIMDEAHHLRWDPDEPSEKWTIAKKLSQATHAMLLLTATPQQYGEATFFGLLNLVDPERFKSYMEFLDAQENQAKIAHFVRELETGGLTPALKEAITFEIEHDAQLLGLLEEEPFPKEDFLKALLDRHGTGRVLFRNRRARLKGFPERILTHIPLPKNQAYLERMQSLKEPDEMTVMDLATGRVNERIKKLSLRDHGKFNWLVEFVKDHAGEKSLVLCAGASGVKFINNGLAEKGIEACLFHEELSIVERDQEAARFADSKGPDLLICSEIGGEGRNFQFAKNLVFMDLPHHPDLVEQRIGRLDRIGQKHDVHIFVPWIEDSPEETLFRWYHDGLDAFQSSWNGASPLLEAFVDDIFDSLFAFIPGHQDFEHRHSLLSELTAQTRKLAEKLRSEAAQSIDLLIDRNSFSVDQGEALLEQVEEADDDPTLEFFIRDLFDHYAIDYDDYDDRGSIIVKPDSLMFIESLPGILPDGESIMTFDREEALKREDMVFLTRDHSMIEGCLGLMAERNEGVASVCKWPDSPFGSGMMVEFSVILTAIGPKELELARFLPTQIKELSYNHNGQRVKEKRHKKNPAVLTEVKDHELQALAPRMNDMITPLLTKCMDKADRWAQDQISHALGLSEKTLNDELSRLLALKAVNPLIKDEDIAAKMQQKEAILQAIQKATPRVDGIRVIYTL